MLETTCFTYILLYSSFFLNLFLIIFCHFFPIIIKGGIIPSVEEVDNLSDEELYSYLSMYKSKIGPVVNSTRDLYRNMLRKAITDGGSLAKHELENESIAATTGSDLAEDFEIIGDEENCLAAGDVQGDQSNDEEDDDDVELAEEVDVIGSNEWVQNDPQEALIDPNKPKNFFFKAFIIGALLSIGAVIVLYLLSMYLD